MSSSYPWRWFSLDAMFLLYIFRTTVFRQNHDKNGRKLPPGPRALPIIGNLHMLGKLPHQSLHHLAKRYGPIMSLKLGSIPTIVVSSPAAAELFLKIHDLVFSSRPKMQASEYLSYGSKGMNFTQYGSYWRTVRKWCTLHLLSASKVEEFAPVRKAHLRSLVESVKKSEVAGEVVDLTRKVGEHIEDTMCQMIFGQDKDDGFNLRSLIDQTMHLHGLFNISDFIPYLAPLDLQGIGRRLRRTNKLLDVVFEKIIDEHVQGTDPNGLKPRKDFVDMMISMLNQPMNPHDEEEPYIIERNNVKAILLDMTAASFDTSAVVIVWAFSEILRHPRVMIRLQQELEAVVGRNRLVEESDLSKLLYLDMVVKESMRLHPVAPFLVPRESMEDVIVDGYFIPKKSRILVNTWSMARDRSIWSANAEEFLPERFIGSNIDLRGHDFELIPFGSGRRGCPGMQLALITVRLVLAQLIHCFDWELPDGMQPNELDMSEIFGLSLPRANHLLAKPTYRLLE
ncbi:cytochrome P450 CYP736A12-like [Hibiscus syriacus]|nr:cytochrome P450 CYP736A12-like [Hibiscus syriacus]